MSWSLLLLIVAVVAMLANAAMVVREGRTWRRGVGGWLVASIAAAAWIAFALARFA